MDTNTCDHVPVGSVRRCPCDAVYRPPPFVSLPLTVGENATVLDDPGTVRDPGTTRYDTVPYDNIQY